MAKTMILPLESIIVMHRDGTSTVTHTCTIEVEINEASVRAMLALKGTSIEDVLDTAANRRRGANE